MSIRWSAGPTIGASTRSRPRCAPSSICETPAPIYGMVGGHSRRSAHRDGRGGRSHCKTGDLMDDVRSLLTQPDLTRRGLLVTSVVSGFAAAVQPVCAQTMITTDSKGLTAGEVMIPTADRQ